MSTVPECEACQTGSCPVHASAMAAYPIAGMLRYFEDEMAIHDENARAWQELFDEVWEKLSKERSREDRDARIQMIRDIVREIT